MKNKKMANAYKNAMGTVFLLAGAFFICSTFLSMRTVLADPIAPSATGQSRVAPARAAARAAGNTRSTVARSTVSRTTSGVRTNVATGQQSASSSRGIATRSIRSRNIKSTAAQPQNTGATRSISSRRISQNDATAPNVAPARGLKARNSNRVVARTATNQTQSRVSLVGNGMRASGNKSGVSVNYLTTKLNTGNYSNIVDSSTGMISADAYSNCLESYYTCMDEICTARSETKGRCSCAGRATNFLAAETALESANEELIQLSGQLALLVATKGKGDDLSYAFSLTDAEKVMNCVSYKDAKEVAGTTKDSSGNTISQENYMRSWCQAHMIYDTNRCSYTTMPDYCSENNNDFGFNIDNIDGSSSDILASLKAWADAKDLAKNYTVNDNNNLVSQYTTISGVVNGLSGITTTVDAEQAQLDGLANKWGYELFEYAHNNVCGRVLDSCFNGIYEACGTPPSGVDSAGNKIGKCANGATTNCPYNYNSAISVTTTGDGAGDVVLNERGSIGSTTSTSATCFGYTSNSGDPYSSLRAPVADARRSIMQKYLLDANAACDAYGTSLKNTAQNINYQKIAAEQALRQKRLQFKQDADAVVLSDAANAATNFDECLSELLDCYESQADNTTYSGAKWTEARIKTYCAQISQVPHCYETMICNPSTAQFHAVIEVGDNASCFNSQDYTKNTCRNVVTLNEILYSPSVKPGYIAAEKTGDSLAMREQCLLDAGVSSIRTWSAESVSQVRCTLAEIRAKDPNASNGYKTDSSSEVCEYITSCNDGFVLVSNKCIAADTDCTNMIPGAAYAAKKLGSNGVWGDCEVRECLENYTLTGNTCVADTVRCSKADLNDLNAAAGTQTWNGSSWDECMVSKCIDDYHLLGNECVSDIQDCTASALTSAHATAGTQTWTGTAWGACVPSACAANYHLEAGKCESNKKSCSAELLTAAHAAAGTQNWNENTEAWGECVLSRCLNGYDLNSGTNTCNVH